MSAVPEPRSEIGRPVTPVWLGQRERGSRSLMAVLAWVTLTLGRAFGRLFLPPIAFYFVAFGPRARAASADYLGRVFGRPARLGEIYRHFHTFASAIHDRVLLLAGRADGFDVTVHGDQPFDAALAEGRGCVLLGAHVGSFEALRSVGAARRGLRVRMVMATGNAARIQSVFGGIRPESADWIIPVGTPTALLRARESLERGEVVGILADRVWRRKRATALPFLGAPARFPLGAFRVAAALGAPVMLGLGLYRGGNRYDVHFERLDQPGDTAATLLERYVARLEHHCHLAPYNWFNFYDFWSEA
jgi:predicted LPLAT superfamily acyltransferase